jgi:hypothetical protein
MPHLKGEMRRVLASSFSEVFDALEPLSGLRELEDSIVVADLVRDVLLGAAEVPVSFETLSSVVGLVHPHSLPVLERLPQAGDIPYAR